MSRPDADPSPFAPAHDRGRPIRRPPATWRARAERLLRGGLPHDPLDWGLAGLLRLAQGPVRAAVATRDLAFRAGLRRAAPEPPGCRVVSVGNLLLGGTGKTPLTIALAAMLAAPPAPRRVAIVLRGYGGRAAREGGAHLVTDGAGGFAPEFDAPTTEAAAARFGDEALLYALRLDGVAVVVAPRRADGVALAARDLAADLVLLDDGFQHRRQRRSVDLLLLDASLPADAMTLFPRGYLREPIAAAARATALVTRHADPLDALLDAKWLGFHPDAALAILSHARRPGGWWRLDAWRPGDLLPPATLRPPRAARLFCFAGIAHPDRFAASVRAATAGADPAAIVGLRALDDHAPLDAPLLASLVRSARRLGADAIATTEKDAVRLLGRWPVGAPPLVVLRERVTLRDPAAWRRHLLADDARPAPPPEASIHFAP